MIKIRLQEILRERHISQKKLSQMTGIRPGTISEICRNTKRVMNFSHVASIAHALNITDIRELVVYVPGK